MQPTQIKLLKGPRKIHSAEIIKRFMKCEKELKSLNMCPIRLSQKIIKNLQNNN